MLNSPKDHHLASSPGSLRVSHRRAWYFFSHDLTDIIGVGRAIRKTVALLYLLLVTVFQRLVCGTNRLRRVATRSADLLPSFNATVLHYQ